MDSIKNMTFKMASFCIYLKSSFDKRELYLCTWNEHCCIKFSTLLEYIYSTERMSSNISDYGAHNVWSPSCLQWMHYN